jgi:anti-sigma B factor antagonist
MTDDASAHGQPAAGDDPMATFEFLPGDGGPATVRAEGDIDLTNVGELADALDAAAAASGAVTADLTAVTYCDSATIRVLFRTARRVRLTIAVSRSGPVTETLLLVSGLDQIAAVVTLD